MLGPGNTPQFMMLAAGRVVLALLLALVASLLVLCFLPRLPFGRRLILRTELDATRGYASAPGSDAQLLGKRGRATSPLRPAGIAEFEGQRVDVVSDGDLIDAGQFVEVIRVDGNRIVVRRTTKTDEKE